MKQLLWVLLVVQALAFAVGLILLSEPAVPGSAFEMHLVGTLTDKLIALIGLLATSVMLWLSASPDRGTRWFGLLVDAAALLVAWLLLHATPADLGVTILAVTFVAFAIALYVRVADRASDDEADESVDELDEEYEPVAYPRYSAAAVGPSSASETSAPASSPRDSAIPGGPFGPEGFPRFTPIPDSPSSTSGTSAPESSPRHPVIPDGPFGPGGFQGYAARRPEGPSGPSEKSAPA